MNTLIIGIDGADFAVIDPWMKRGRLPNIARLIREGMRAPLHSTWPHNTSPAWPAMVTGMSPGELGLFDFHRPKGYGKRIVSSREIPCPPLWQILSKNGKKVAVVGVPMTYPPAPVNGAMVAGFLSPTGRNNAWPFDLLDRIPELSATSTFAKDEDALLRRARNIATGTRALLSEVSPDVSMVVFNSSDWSMHFHWGKRAIIRRVFEAIDRHIGMLIDHAKPDNVVLVSDHGFRPITHFLDVNDVLRQSGFLHHGDDLSRLYPTARDLRDERGDSKRAPRQPGRFAAMWLRFRETVLRLLSGHVRNVAGFSNVFSSRFMESKGSSLAALSAIDWSTTRAYVCSPASGTINLNLKGREPNGIVELDDFERVRDEVIAALSEWRTPESGRQVFQWVARPEQIYSGSRISAAPDIFFSLEPGLYTAAMKFGRPLWRVRGIGQHAPYGIFVGSGEMFGRGRIPEMDITDVVPTLLAGMGIETEATFDGTVRHLVLRGRSGKRPATSAAAHST
jgi:predicted AlkP superfamily phosphohydrolase/phosphomutase